MEEKKISQTPVPKSPGLAAFLAAIFTPLGALYNGQYLKFIVFLLVFAGLISLNARGEAQPMAGLLLAGFWFFAIFEAYHTAKKINQKTLYGKEAETVEEIPEELKAGSIFWGLFLIALGIIFLLANFELISYSQLLDFWPVAIVIIGLKLLFDYFSKEKQTGGEK
ncbi:MAG: LiaI-LiaF-like domain-containing protein [Candidatus Aminicenantia bacterium]